LIIRPAAIRQQHNQPLVRSNVGGDVEPCQNFGIRFPPPVGGGFTPGDN